MSIVLEWLKYPHEKGVDDEGIARFKIGENYHHVNVTSIANAIQLHKLLQHAHDAGLKNGNALTIAEEHQRVKDWLSG
jgi:hypothetical protein